MARPLGDAWRHAARPDFTPGHPTRRRALLGGSRAPRRSSSCVSLLIATTTVLLAAGCVRLDHETLRLPSHVLLRLPRPGRVDEFLDWVYFTVVIHTTLGPRDLVPSGAIRFRSGTRAPVGFTRVSRSAAFAFLEMERCWREGSAPRRRAACGAGRGRAVGG